jgi:serine/threonine-protein kinase
MGAVYKARQVSMDRLVALKILPPKLARDKEFAERFLRETRASARVNHENIVRGIDAGPVGSTYYLAMEYVEGPSVREMIRSRGRLEPTEAVGIALQIARALAAASDAGLIHRDVKPDNILVTPEGVAKLCDLGLAHVVSAGGEGDPSLTQDGMVLGTPHYMAPEQARGEPNLDSRTDIYALGATLYMMLTGRVPFDGPTSAAVMARQIRDPFPDPRALVPDCPESVIAVMRKMVAKERSERYQSPRALAVELDSLHAFLKGGGEAPELRAPPLRRATEKTEIVRADRKLTHPRPRRVRGHKTKGAVGSALVAVVGMGAVAAAAIGFLTILPLTETSPTPTRFRGDEAAASAAQAREAEETSADSREEEARAMLEHLREQLAEKPGEAESILLALDRNWEFVRGTGIEPDAKRLREEIVSAAERTARSFVTSATHESERALAEGRFDRALAALDLDRAPARASGELEKARAKVLDAARRALRERLARVESFRPADREAAASEVLRGMPAEVAAEARREVEREVASALGELGRRLPAPRKRQAGSTATRQAGGGSAPPGGLSPEAPGLAWPSMGTTGGRKTGAPAAGTERLGRLVAEFFSLVDKEDFAGAGQWMGRASGQEEFAPFAEDLRSSARVAAWLADRRLAIRRAVEARQGQNVSLHTGKGLLRGIVGEVSDQGFHFNVRVMLAGRGHGETRMRVSWDDLDPDTDAWLVKDWKPGGLEGALARAIIALGRDDLDAAASELEAARDHYSRIEALRALEAGDLEAAQSVVASPQEHPLARHLREKMAARRNRGLEEAARAAWKEIESASAAHLDRLGTPPRAHRGAAHAASGEGAGSLLREIRAFEERYGGTVFGRSVDGRLSEIKARLAGREDVLQGLVLWLKFDEGAGGRTRDWSPDGRSASVHGAAWARGREGYALRFDGRGDRVVVHGTFDPPERGTVSFRMRAASRADQRIIGGHNYYEVRILDGRLMNDLSCEGRGCASAMDIPVGRWCSVACTYDQGTGRSEVYMDGALVGTDDETANTDPGRLTITVGTRTGSTDYYEGLLDDVRIYDRVLSREEIAVLAGRPAPAVQHHAARPAAPPQPAGPLFEDDFSDPDGSYRRWTPWSGSWSVEGGACHQTQAADGRLTVAGDDSWTDYAVEARIRISGPGDESGNGIMFRVVDRDSYYLMSVDAGSRTVELWRRDGEYETLAEGFMRREIDPRRWYTLRAEVEGGSIRAYVDGDLAIETTDAAHAAGKIGLDASVEAWFDDVKVTALGGGAPAATGLVFEWRMGREAARVRGPGTGGWRPCPLSARGRARMGERGAMVLEGGAFIAGSAAGPLLEACRRTNEFAVEAVFATDDLDQTGPARIVTFSTDSVSRRNFTLCQERDRLVLRLGTSRGYHEEPMCRFRRRRPNHVVASYSPGRLVCFLNGEPVFGTRRVRGDLSSWHRQQLAFGDEPGGGRSWSGRIMLVAVYDRFVEAGEARAGHERLRRFRERE